MITSDATTRTVGVDRRDSREQVRGAGAAMLLLGAWSVLRDPRPTLGRVNKTLG